MTITVLELLVGALLLYCAIWCRAFVPALGGQNKPGTHCTGSLIALAIAGLSYLFAAIFGGALAAAIGAAAKRATGKAAPRPTPTPSPLPLPSPSPTPPRGLPAPSPSPVPSPGGGEGLGTTLNLVY
jgi:hypothetical protein